MAARWADLLVDYCLGVEPGETIVLSSSVLAQPLVEASYKAIVGQGGHPLLRLEVPGAPRVLPRKGQRGTTRSSPAGSALRGPEGRGQIRIAAESDIRSMSRVDPRRQAAYDRARDPIRQAARQGGGS